MLGVFERAGFELTRELADGVVEVQFPIALTERFELSVEERDHTAVVASLRSFFEPASVAIVGASPRRGTIGGELFRNVLEGDFAGAAYPVNPKGAAVAGVRGYASVAEIPDPVDLAVIAVPGEHVLAAAEEALRTRSAGARRDLGRLRRGRQRRSRAAGAAARARTRPRRAPDRAELSRHRGRRAAPERHLRRPLGAERQHRLLLPVRRARSCAARGRRCSRAGAVRLRLDREQGGRLLERPARVVGGGRSHRSRAPLRRVVRKSAPLRPARPAGRAAQADSRAEERHLRDRPARRQLAYRCACGLRGRRRRALPPGRRHSRDLAGGADRRRDAALLAARAEGEAGRRAHECRRARHPRRRRLRRSRTRAPRARRGDRAAACASCCPRRPASRTRSTCSDRPPRRATSRRSRSCWPTRRSTRCSCSSSRRSARQPTRLRSQSTQRPVRPAPRSRCSPSS